MLNVNAGKNKVMVLGIKSCVLIDFGAVMKCKKTVEFNCKLNIIEEVLVALNKFKDLGTVLCRNSTMEGEIRYRPMQGRRGIEVLEKV